MKGETIKTRLIFLSAVLFVFLMLVQPAYSQPQAQEIARYEGNMNSSEVYQHMAKTYSGLCPQELPAVLVLNSDGTLFLSYTHHKISFHATDNSVTCSVSMDDENRAEIEIRGVYEPNSMTFSFSSIWVKSGNEWVQLTEASGNGDYTASSARGQLVFSVFGAETHIIFDLPSIATAAPPLGKGCYPQPRGLTPAKPGDIISPGADYFDVDGKATGIIQERWYFNGKQGASIIWDGSPVQVELQWTCLDNSGHVQEFLIPAYQEGQTEEKEISPPAEESAKS